MERETENRLHILWMSSLNSLSGSSTANIINDEQIQLFDRGELDDKAIDALFKSDSTKSDQDSIYSLNNICNPVTIAPVVHKPTDISFFYNNVTNKRDHVHEILGNNRFDIILLIDIPWYQIGANHLLSNQDNHMVFGTVNNPAYQYFHPTGNLFEQA